MIVNTDIDKEFIRLLGADTASLIELSPHPQHDHCINLSISWKFSLGDWSKTIKNTKNIAQDIDNILTMISDRIAYGEIKKLRERCSQLETQMMASVKTFEDKIKDLERYKIAFELNGK